MVNSRKQREEERGTMVLAETKQSFKDFETSLVIINSKNSHSYRKLIQSFKILFHSHRFNTTHKPKIRFFLQVEEREKRKWNFFDVQERRQKNDSMNQQVQRQRERDYIILRFREIEKKKIFSSRVKKGIFFFFLVKKKGILYSYL